MRYYSLIVVYLIFFGNQAVSAGSWENIGCPRGLAPTGLYIDENERVFAGSYYHGLFYSDDLGKSWVASTFDSDEEFLRVEDVTSNGTGRHYASTITGIFASEDGGETWGQIYPAYWDSRYHQIDILNSGTVFCWNALEILRSQDHGASWSRIWDNSNYDNTLRALAISNAQNVYIADNTGKLYASGDEGESWTEVNLPIVEDDFEFYTEIIFSNNDSLLYLYTFSEGYIFKISLSDSSYSIINQRWGDWPLGISPDGKLLYNIEENLSIYDPATGVATLIQTQGELGHLISANSEALWVSPDTVLLSNNQYELFLSPDGGSTWETLKKDFPYRIPLALEANNGRLIVSAHQSYFSGFSYYTDDYGESWVKTNMVGKAYSIEKLYGNRLIAGGSGGVYISSDNGSNWHKNTSVGLVYALFVTLDGTIFIGNGSEGIYRSTDGGSRWHSVNNGYGNNYSFGFGEIASGRIFSCGWPSGTYFSDNNGGQWNQMDIYPFSAYRSYSFCGTQDTIVAGMSSGIALSQNGGETWTFVHYSPESIRRVYRISTGDYLALSKGEGVLRSVDNGQTWETFNDSLGNLQVFDLAFDSTNTMYLATAGGIYMNDAFVDTTTPDQPPQVVVPSLLYLKTPYPNPFNNAVTIEFNLSSPARVDMRIFSIRGRNITTLIENDYVASGDYRIIWKPAGQASGIYILALRADDKFMSRKISYIK